MAVSGLLLWSPVSLQWLTYTFNMRMIIVLYGILIYAQFNTPSPLILAAMNKHWHVVEYLLTDEYHFDVNAVHLVMICNCSGFPC